MMKKKKNRKKVKRPFKRGELVFNVISLILLICVGLYYEIRCYKAFDKQFNSVEMSVGNLSGIVINKTRITTNGKGLYKDEDGYFFKGNVANNYVKFGNRLFRIIRVYNDGSVKVISDDVNASFMNGEADYLTGNVKMFLNKTDNNINAKDRSGVYFDTIPYPEKFIKKTSYTIDTIGEKTIEHGEEEYKDYVTTLNIDDYIKAGGKNSYLNINKYFYVLGIKEKDQLLYIDEEGSVNGITSTESYGVRSVITFKKGVSITGGNGVMNKPYVIKQEKNTNYVGAYVRLGNDKWKVFSDKQNRLKLVYTGYIRENKQFVLMEFSDESNKFNLYDYGSVTRYLNYDFYDSRPYKKLLLNEYQFIGELTYSNKYKYNNIYNDKVISKVGLLNLFDYNNTSVLDDYYLVNSNDADTLYVYHNNGSIEEASYSDARYLVPVITINKQAINRGSGSEDDPYMV